MFESKEKYLINIKIVFCFSDIARIRRVMSQSFQKLMLKIMFIEEGKIEISLFIF